MISAFRTSDFQISGSAISSHKNIHYRKECQKKPELKVQSDMYEENRKLRQELEELKKENAFLKKAAAFFAREID